MKNLKLLIIILIIFAIGIIGMIITLGFMHNENETSNLNFNDVANNTINTIGNNISIEEQNVVNSVIEKPEVEEQYSSLELMEKYLSDYTYQVFNNVENAYNLLNEEYRNKRFGSIEEFKEYIVEKQEQLSNIKLIQYKVEDGYGYTIYKGTDENGNYYYIRATSDMEYTIILDNYTMQADYTNADTEEKIKRHTQKFILMINSADYTNAYNLLEPTFKATYFPTEQDFIKYIKTNWFKRNIIATREVTEDGICIVTMRETIATTSNKMQKQFKVTLGEGMDFTIEFNI